MKNTRYAKKDMKKEAAFGRFPYVWMYFSIQLSTDC